jgi:adenylate cyclase
MADEIERKFLVTGEGWKQQVESSTRIRQAYLATTDRVSVRIRIVDDEKAFVTIKSAQPGKTRSEYEYPVPVADAEDLIRLRCSGLIEKRRHRVPQGGLCWEVDVFAGRHEGLILAEIEFPTDDADVECPEWIGREVTDDKRYYNADLAANGVPKDG